MERGSPHSASPDNLFMSHAWGKDLRGRSTHERARLLKNALSRAGWKVWFDDEKLLIGCNIDVKMASGITAADAVCICVTRQYVEKINSQNRHDSCAKEWNFAQAMGKKILPLIMEEEMLDVKAWPQGVMSMYMANTFYIDCSGNDLEEIAQRLSKMLHLLGLRPRLRPSYSWPIFRSSSSKKVLKRTSTQIRI